MLLAVEPNLKVASKEAQEVLALMFNRFAGGYLLTINGR